MRREERIRRFNEDIVKFGELPSDYKKFAEEVVFKFNHYIFYSRKDKFSYCTGCKTHLHHYEFKHNEWVNCPHCGRRVKSKATGYSKNVEDILWSVYIDRYEEDLTFQYVRHIRTFNIAPELGFVKVNIQSLEKQRTLSSMHRKVRSYEYDECEKEWRNYRQRPYCYYPSVRKDPCYGMHLYNMNLDSITKETGFKYSCFEQYAGLIRDDRRDYLVSDKHKYFHGYGYALENYLEKYRNNTWLEQLWKVGLEKLALEILDRDDWYVREHISPGKNILQTLKLTRNEYKVFRACGEPNKEKLKILHLAQAHGIELNKEQLVETSLMFANARIGHTDFFKMLQHSTFHKVTKYLKKIGALEWNTYRDYLDMAEKLKWDMKSSFVLFPKNVKEAHDNAVKEFNRLKQKNFKLGMKEIIESGLYDFEDKNYTIVIPKTSSEITKEGQKLNHCVARYIDQVVKGETLILFLRKKNQIDKPFYTIEYKNNKVVQCKGKSNCDMTDEVKDFMKRFEEKVQKAS